MESILVCKICLAVNVKMFMLSNTPLREIYEKLTDIPFDRNDERPKTVCYLCVARLNNCRKLQKLAIQTDKILTNLLNSKVEIEESSIDMFRSETYRFLSVELLKSIQHPDSDDNYNDIDDCELKSEHGDDVKSEPHKPEKDCNDPVQYSDIDNNEAADSDDDVPLKSISKNKSEGARKKVSKRRHKTVLNPIEDSCNNIDGCLVIEVKREQGDCIEQEVFKRGEESNDPVQYSDLDNNEAADSDDDVPLKSISKNNGEGEREKVTKRRKKTESILNSTEIILTHQQQMFELSERAKSLNYLNSPFKCDLCYKGFIHAPAYENHKEKHSEVSGALECWVCRLRYTSSRQLRTHAAAAHERRYVCNRCQHTSHTKNQALIHERWHNGHTYPCKLCGEVFSRPTTYLTHIRKTHASEHVCVRCGRSFVGRHGLLMHESKAHRDTGQKLEDSTVEEKRRCKQCDIVFSSLEAFTRHVLTSVKHTPWNEDSTQCRICEASVQPEFRRAHVREHARAMAGAEPPRSEPLAMLTCEQCPSQFPSRARLSAHVRAVHLGVKYDKNVICELCGKKCTSHARLRYHQRRHTGHRPHVCVTCNARFVDSNQLRIHTRKHSGEKPYSCSVCGKRFSQRAALTRHYRVHTGAKPYECQLCSKTFSQSNSVKLHVNTVHLKIKTNRKRGKRAPEES